MNKTFFEDNWVLLTAGITFTIFCVVYLMWLIARVKHSSYKPDEYEYCVRATHNIDGCEKVVYPERYKERQEKEAYYRKRVQVK